MHLLGCLPLSHFLHVAASFPDECSYFKRRQSLIEAPAAPRRQGLAQLCWFVMFWEYRKVLSTKTAWCWLGT
jgi:hypothetical protein